MYIFKFLKSLKLLRKEYLPDFDCFPKGKVIYYGQYKIVYDGWREPLCSLYESHHQTAS